MRDDFLPYYRPVIEPDDIEAVASSMSRGWLTSGQKVREFEEAFSAIFGVEHAVALNSCTAALHLALIALGVGDGDEVVMPSLTFVAGANCVRHLGARPVFADVDADTLCITPSTIDRVIGPRTKVVMSVNYGGQPVGIDEIVSYAKAHGIAVLEDAAHAVGTLDEGWSPGVKSDAAAFSFYATKNITTAEGGMLATNRRDIMERARALSLHGLDRDAWERYSRGGTWRYDVTEIGYKYNMPDMAAALGLAQLRKLGELQEKRDTLASAYLKQLGAIPGIQPATLPATLPSRNSWCLFVIAIDERETCIPRDDLIEELRKANIGTSVHFIPIHTFSAYRSPQTHLPVTERVWKNLISLPLYPNMTEKDVGDVVKALALIIERARTSARDLAI